MRQYLKIISHRPNDSTRPNITVSPRLDISTSPMPNIIISHRLNFF